VAGFRDSLGEFAARPKRISEPPPEWSASAHDFPKSTVGCCGDGARTSESGH
jgi:hypothetical protein